MFQKAVKYQAKGRVAFVGPPSAGKSYTMLTLATVLAKGGRIAAVDTEHGSLSKYADLFDFDVIELSSFAPENFLRALKDAADSGHTVFCCDSLSHFWVGKDGALEFVDQRKARAKDQMAGWKDFRPYERAMVDAMIASPCHVLCTMRTKTEYSEITDPDTGRKKRIKVGLAPVQREGLEYEFDLVAYMDPEDNTFIVDKTRCPVYSGKAIKKPGADAFAPFATWLEGSTRPGPAVPAAPSNGQGHSSAEQPVPVPMQTITDLRQLLTEVGGAEAKAVDKVSPGKFALNELTADEAEILRARLLEWRSKHPAASNSRVAS